VNPSIFANPVFIFSLIWLLILFTFRLVDFNFFVSPNLAIDVYILFCIAQFIFIYFFIKKIFFKPRKKNISFSNYELHDLKLFLNFIFLSWLSLYLINIIYNQGTPLIWLLIGNGKTYLDFGIPTLTGFLNMLRAFLVVGFFILFLKGKGKKNLVYLLILFFSAFNELARGNVIFLLSHALAVYLMLFKLTFKKLLLASIGIITFPYTFYLLATLRGTGGFDFSSFLSQGSEGYGIFTWPLIYFLQPINNLYYGIDFLEILYFPFNTVQLFVPSAALSFLGFGSEYSFELATEAFNALPIFATLIADWGLYISLFFMGLIQIFVSFVYIQALNGKKDYLLLYPPFFSALLLSFFHGYLLSLVVISYPLILGIYRIKEFRLEFFFKIEKKSTNFKSPAKGQ
tara:strand:- start:1529 stop:2728 length:1200 start_codon:yes stop_codon:yes gene_type:complete